MELTPLLSWWIWDPDPVAFTLPIIDRPVRWYGIFFVSGFIVSYFMMLALFRQHLRLYHPSANSQWISNRSFQLVDRMSWGVILGTIIGARLGHVLFYDLDYHLSHPFDIVKVWEGGLASHGGAVGVMIALWIYQRWATKQEPSLSFIRILDMICIPTALVGCLIRMGNFFNQEISGTVSDLSWAVLFLHPFDGVSSIPRHPVQLYEALVYFLTFCLLLFFWIKRRGEIPEGRLIGLFFILVFGFRILLEPFKAPLGHVFDESLLSTGQYLSIPFVIAGAWLLWRSRRSHSSPLHMTENPS